MRQRVRRQRSYQQDHKQAHNHHQEGIAEIHKEVAVAHQRLVIFQRPFLRQAEEIDVDFFLHLECIDEEEPQRKDRDERPDDHYDMIRNMHIHDPQGSGLSLPGFFSDRHFHLTPFPGS